MTVLFIDGFDKYAAPSGSTVNIGDQMAGEWTTFANVAMADPLSAAGYAITVPAATAISKSLGANKARLIAGFRFTSDLVNSARIFFSDAGTVQASVYVLNDGSIALYRGSSAGVLIANAGSISAGTTHYLEVDLTFDNAGAYNVYLDGVSIFSGSGDLQATANNYANSFSLQSVGSNTFVVDDLYVFDDGGSTNNAPLLTSPVVETTYPSADSSVQFAFGAAALGFYDSFTGAVNAPGANKLFLVPVTPEENVSLVDVNCVPMATSGGAKFKAVLYNDTAGAPSSHVATGTETVGATSGSTLTSAFGSPQALTGGTQYWIGFITDTSVSLARFDQGSTTQGQVASNTYGSGAPGSAPAMTTGASTWQLWGSVTGASNYDIVNNFPAGAADISYVSSSTANDEDLFTLPSLSVTPNNIYTAAVKAWLKKSDAGARTVDLEMKSGGTTGDGSNAGQAPGTSYQWLASYFEEDPDTTNPWDAAGINAATIGYEIDT